VLWVPSVALSDTARNSSRDDGFYRISIETEN